MKTIKSLLLTSVILIVSSCGSKTDLTKKPVDDMIRDMNDVPTFSIILYDMDTEGSFFKKYKHQYQLIVGGDSTTAPKEEITGWYEVKKDYFMLNIDNMGMEIVSKNNGELNKTVSPPGYGSYVGNPSYGRWVDRDGTSFWEFYGRYAMMSTMFNMMMYPARMSYWNDYRTNYYGSGRSYYGPSSGTGTYMYGTSSAYNSSRTSSRWNTNTGNSALKSRVQGSTSKSTRSSSRFSSTSRTRSSGFGK